MNTSPIPPADDEVVNHLSKREYWCFISYRHADNKEPGRQWATWLHQALETYEVPADLVGTKNERGDIIPERIFPVFRDEEELPADAELSRPIESALQRSRFLVVLCSPQSVASRWVADEILRFQQLGKQNRILAAIIKGHPNATDDPSKPGAHTECFPIPLRFEIGADGQLSPKRTEPIAADFRLPDGSEGWTSPAAHREVLSASDLPDKQISTNVAAYATHQNLMLLKIVAGVLGVPLGLLTQRDKVYQLEKQRLRTKALRRWLALAGTLLIAAVVAGLLAYKNGVEASVQRDVAEARRVESDKRKVEAEVQRNEAIKSKKEADEQRTKAEAQTKVVAAKSQELSDTLGSSYFLEGNARLRDVSTAREGLSYLARAVREHRHQMSANRLLTFLQQRAVWILEDVGEAKVNTSSPQRAQRRRLNIAGPTSDEPGKTDLVAQGPQGQIAVSWCEDTESNRGSNHPGSGLHHFRVWDKFGKPLTPWIKADHDASHWVSNITGMAFSPDGSCLAVTVGRWRQPEYLQVWHVGSGKQIGETIIATGENPNAQGASFTFVKFGAVKRLQASVFCDLLAGSSRGDAYWIRFMNLSGINAPYSNEIALVSHRSALRSAHLQTGKNDILVTGSADGELRFTLESGGSTSIGIPTLKLGRPIIDINAAEDGRLNIATDEKIYRVVPMSPIQAMAESVELPRLVVRVENDHEVTVEKDSQKGEVVLKKVFTESIKARGGVSVQSLPPSLRVAMEDGTIHLFRIEAGKAELVASGKGQTVIFQPNGRATKIALQSSIADLRLACQPLRVITATTDFVYQVFDPQSGMAVSKLLDERILFSQGGAPSAVGGLGLSPSGSVLLSQSQHWEPPNLMMSWTTLWDCITGEPISDRVTYGDDDAPASIEQSFVNDDTAKVGGPILHTASAEMFPLLADIAEELAGMTLNGKGEMLQKGQSQEVVAAMLRRLQAFRK